MKILLDTHALLWWMLDDSRLSKSARRVIADTDNEVFVSPVSGYELAFNGKLPLPDARMQELRSGLREFGMSELPITMNHAVTAGALTSAHRDPFDRMLIAQSRVERIPVVTHDPIFAQHNVEVIW